MVDNTPPTRTTSGHSDTSVGTGVRAPTIPPNFSPIMSIPFVNLAFSLKLDRTNCLMWREQLKIIVIT